MKIKKIFSIILIIIIILFFFIYRLFFSLDAVKFDKNAVITASVSPTKKYALIFYKKYGGSLSHDGVVGQVNNKNFLYTFPCYDIDINWIDENVVNISWKNPRNNINEQILIDLSKSKTYDWRNK